MNWVRGPSKQHLQKERLKREQKQKDIEDEAAHLLDGLKTAYEDLGHECISLRRDRGYPIEMMEAENTRRALILLRSKYPKHISFTETNGKEEGLGGYCDYSIFEVCYKN